MGALDQMTKQAGEGLSALLNGIIHGADRAISAVAGKVSEITGSALAGVSELGKGISDVASSFSLGGGHAPEVVQEPVKLGRNANKPIQAVDNSLYAASLNDIQVPTVGAPGQNRSSGLSA